MQLMATAEIAQLLGVSRQRVWQLTSTPGFPEPVATLEVAKVWQRRDVESWAKSTGRLP